MLGWESNRARQNGQQNQRAIFIMEISQNILEILGYVYCGIALLLSLLTNIIFKVPSRGIDYIQWAYIFASVFTTAAYPFSAQLKTSYTLITLKATTQEWFCDMSTWTCAVPFGISFAVILCGVILIFRFITIAEKVREKGLTFHRVYRFLKGLIRWFYLPFSYTSLDLLLNKKETVPAVIIVAICVIFPIVQVILYKNFPETDSDDASIKFIELASYGKNFIFALLLVLGPKFSTTAPYFYIPLLIVSFGFLYSLQYNFKYQVTGRVFYILGEAIMYFLCGLYVASSNLVEKYQLDLFLLGAILLMDLVYTIIEMVHAYRNRDKAEIVPEDSGEVDRKKNRFEVDEDSRDNLNNSQSSSKILGKSGSKNNVAKRARR